MIYFKEGESHLQKTAGFVLATIQDNLRSFVILTKELTNSSGDSITEINLQARLLASAFSTAEKLLLLNLYARNPSSLMDEKDQKKASLAGHLSFETYDAEWLYRRSPKFVKPEIMWETLSTFLNYEGAVGIDNLKTDFMYLKNIRNKYLHVFIIKVDPKSFYLIRDFVWLLLVRLFDALPASIRPSAQEILQDCGCDPGIIERIRDLDEDEIIIQVLEKYGNTLNEISNIPNEKNKRLHILKKFVSEDFLNGSVPIYMGGEPVLETTPDGDEVHVEALREDIELAAEINLDCPICTEQRQIHSSGFLHVDVEEVHHREDNEGDYLVHEPPVDAEIIFNHFYCVGCGFFSNEYYLLEKLGFGEILKAKIWFDWDINDGVGKPFEDGIHGVDILEP
ncbi:hypothetical protein BH10BDE1_BH10BDE1_27920 [soil metagenome]